MALEPPRKRQRTKEDVIGKDGLTGDPETWKGKSLASVEQVPRRASAMRIRASSAHVRRRGKRGRE